MDDFRKGAIAATAAVSTVEYFRAVEREKCDASHAVNLTKGTEAGKLLNDLIQRDRTLGERLGAPGLLSVETSKQIHEVIRKQGFRPMQPTLPVVSAVLLGCAILGSVELLRALSSRSDSSLHQ
jgi:hypothetical protein